MLDIFHGDAYGVVSLTEAINRLPLIPTRIDELGLFEDKGITTTSVVIERRDGKIELLPTAARGAMPTTNSQVKKEIRSFAVPHIPKNDAVMADEVQGVRAFGEEDVTETIADKVNEKMQAMKDAHALTWEWMRSQVIQGKLIDGDGTSVLFNYFTEFGITETVIDINFGTDDVKMKALEIIRAMEDALGAAVYDHIHVLCGDDFFDTLITDDSVKEAFSLFKDNQFAREIEPQRRGFLFADIVWENYRAKVGSTPFIDAAKARVIPIGVKGLFKRYNAPAPFVESVNTMGKPLYAKQEPMRFGVGIELHTNSNPLFLPTRPEVLIGLTAS